MKSIKARASQDCGIPTRMYAQKYRRHLKTDQNQLVLDFHQLAPHEIVEYFGQRRTHFVTLQQ